MLPTLTRLFRFVATSVLLFAPCASPLFAAEAAHLSAMESITSAELLRHVDVLADDTLEGRAAGSRGGLAAARYIESELKKLGVAPAGPGGAYFQPFSAGYHNVLAEIPGSDPALADERVLIGAHYDHVGYGTPRTSYGPIGFIHNGADDNASGVATVLELADALRRAGAARRTIVLAFWDGEEQGLLGSRHWAANPTTPFDTIKLAINLDMVGRLRDGALTIGGTRSGFGLRNLVASRSLDPSVKLIFDWDLKPNSDHWPFIERNVPTIFLFTGLHDDYHRPSDDVEKLNVDGIRVASQCLFDIALRAANADAIPTYRAAGRTENEHTHREREQPLAPATPRLGVAYREHFEDREHDTKDEAKSIGVEITGVREDAAADRAGIQVGDRVVEVAGESLDAPGQFASRLLAAPSETTLTIVRGGETEPETIDVTLPGDPVQLGISWRADDAEPNAVYLTRVIPGSPAALAGLRPFDRVLRVNDRAFANMAEFSQQIHEALASQAEPIHLLVETNGRLHDVVIDIGG